MTTFDKYLVGKQIKLINKSRVNFFTYDRLAVMKNMTAQIIKYSDCDLTVL